MRGEGDTGLLHPFSCSWTFSLCWFESGEYESLKGIRMIFQRDDVVTAVLLLRRY